MTPEEHEKARNPTELDLLEARLYESLHKDFAKHIERLTDRMDQIEETVKTILDKLEEEAQ